MLKALDANQAPTSTIQKFIEKVSPFNTEEFSKDVYLNQCIEDLYLELEAILQKKGDDIQTMKKEIDRTEQILEHLDMDFGDAEGEIQDMPR